MNIVITGGSGYLALRAADYLINKSLKVRLLVSKKSNFETNNKLEHENLTIKKIDWESKENIQETIDGCDVMLHFAGMNANDCFDNPMEAYNFNALKTNELLDCAVKTTIKKFIFFSTVHVYKKNLMGFINENTPASNDHPYGTSNKAGEDFVINCQAKNEMECFILRLSNAFGAPLNINQNCWSLLINNICRQIFEDGKIVIHSDPNQFRNFVSIESINNIIYNFITKNYIKSGIIYNVGSDNTLTIRQIAEYINNKYHSTYGKKINIDYTYQHKNELKKNDIKFEYSIEKIKKTGFYKDYFDKEVTHLLNFCKDNF